MQPVWIPVRQQWHIRAFGPTTKTAAKEGDGSGMRAYLRRQTTLECLEQWQARLQQDQSEAESTVETEEQRQVRREQAWVNLERQNTERREDRLVQWGCAPGRQGCLRVVSKGRLYRLDQTRLHDRETRASEGGEQRVKRSWYWLFHFIMLCRTVYQHRHQYTTSSCPGDSASNF